ADVNSLEDRAVRISPRAEAAGACQQVAQVFTFLDSICSGMNNLAFQLHRSADVFPTCNLANGQDITGMQAHICVWLAVERVTDGNRNVLSLNTLSLLDRVAGQLGLSGICRTLKTASRTHQFRCGHLRSERIFARPWHLALNLNRRGIEPEHIFVNKHSVLRLEKNIRVRIAIDRFAQVGTDDPDPAIAGFSEDLHIVELSVRRSI